MDKHQKPGGPLHQILIKLGNATARTVTLASGVNRVGRNPASDIHLDDATVSARHCEIVVLDDDVFVRDVGSTNGTFIDGKRVMEAALLPGQKLHVGAVETTVEALARVAIPQLPSPQETHPVLPDGVAACVNHSASCATMECTQCRKSFCELCVHLVRRVGGAALKLCPSCSGQCQAILPEAAPQKKRKSKLASWFGKVTAKMTGRLARTGT
jgi:hypothetical protein